MTFVGEDTYRQALADAERYESISASVRIVDLKSALAEIERLQGTATEYDDLIRHMDAGGDFYEFQAARMAKNL